jgi:hypothetical protein
MIQWTAAPSPGNRHFTPAGDFMRWHYSRSSRVASTGGGTGVVEAASPSTRSFCCIFSSAMMQKATLTFWHRSHISTASSCQTSNLPSRVATRTRRTRTRTGTRGRPSSRTGQTSRTAAVATIALVWEKAPLDGKGVCLRVCCQCAA